jgi:hypothetical protein
MSTSTYLLIPLSRRLNPIISPKLIKLQDQLLRVPEQASTLDQTPAYTPAQGES